MIKTRQLLSDQRGLTLEEALKNVAGVKARGYDRDRDDYRIRGFDAAFTTDIDGRRGEDGTGIRSSGS